MGGSYHSLALVLSPGQVCRSRVVQPGGDYLLTAPLAVGQPARLQWYHDGVLVRLGSALWLTNVQSADLGQYVAVSQFPFGRVMNVVIQLQSAPPRLAAKIQSPGQVALTLYGNVGTTYAIESAPALGGGTNWHVLAPNILLTNQSQVLNLPTGSAPATLYQARAN